MNINRRVVLIAIAVAVAFLLLIICFTVIPSAIISIVTPLAFNFDLTPLGTIMLFIMLTMFFLLIFVLALTVVITKALGYFTPGMQITWPTKTLLVTLSIATAWLSGILFVKSGYILLVNYNLPFAVSATILMVGIILFIIATGLALGCIITKPNKKWAYAVLITVLLFLFVDGITSYYRRDYFNPKTGNIEIYITPSTQKAWRDKPKYIKYDPETREEIRLATEEEIKKIIKQKNLKPTFSFLSLFSDKKDKLKLTEYPFELNKGELKSTISVPDKSTIQFSSNEAFYVVERFGINDDGTEKLTDIKMPQGNSKRYFTWGGTVRVQGMYDNTKLTVLY
ncbi:hypothetical protein KAU19_03795 [Candidatus Parcubacteria bacterium]|nr:hypothetical protein [Candidatus Parcubacteria bacterium]